MRRLMILTLVLFAALLSGCASSRAPQDPVFMWEAQREGATIHLLGSIHAGQQSWYPMDAAINEALAAADTVACELNIKDPQVAMQTALLVQREGMYPEGESLQENVPPEVWQQVVDRLGNQVPAVVLNRMRPGLVAVTLAQVALADAGLDMGAGVDMHVIGKAEESGQPVVPLETAEDQVALLFGPNAVIDAKMLAETLEDDTATMMAMFDSLVVAWKAGDAERMEQIYREDWLDDADMQAFHEELLVKRNHGMADKLEHRQGNWFVVVGALHLCGEVGVPALLEEAGWLVRQVEKASPPR